ncbi:uncharacterized protein LOC118407433 [Branchiostoma floridae]|uniref:Uncharacterized protein LOC118407433 n=1 Tax=Branchiostoma floridae TaxID=7739 RepID=A0A9J7HSS1_BRAFL|nr:uncharacterized protein LOC118407433 [Branchiostoma floridae]XP_035663801.1 uncharacterized protein LOC118407433 [Branchiostoma floridae]
MGHLNWTVQLLSVLAVSTLLCVRAQDISVFDEFPDDLGFDDLGSAIGPIFPRPAVFPECTAGSSCVLSCRYTDDKGNVLPNRAPVRLTMDKQEERLRALVSRQEEVIYQQGLLEQQQQQLVNLLQASTADQQLAALDSETCLSCSPTQWCEREGKTQCRDCTVCQGGYRARSDCTKFSDATCIDIDECREGTDTCKADQLCVNTQGTFVCVESVGRCPKDSYFDLKTKKCESCSVCTEGISFLYLPCGVVNDSVCTPSVGATLSSLWMGKINDPSLVTRAENLANGIKVDLNSFHSQNNSYFQNMPRKGMVKFRKHGFVTVTFNFAARHSCNDFLQFGVRTSELGGLAAARLTELSGKYFQGSTISTTVEVDPQDELSLDVKSGTYYCFKNSNDARYSTTFEEIAADNLAGPMSLLWLSHESAAVFLRAETRQTTYETGWRATFNMKETSDHYILRLDSYTYFNIREGGNLRFSFMQAYFLSGQACRSNGLVVIPKLLKRDGQVIDLFENYQRGVPLQYNSILTAGSVPVEYNDKLFFDVETARSCKMYFYGNNEGVGTVSLLWVPFRQSALYAGMLVNGEDLFGVGEETQLRFQEVNNTDTRTLRQLRNGKLKFKRSGRILVDYHGVLMHSCAYAKVTVYYENRPGATPIPFAQQVQGKTDSEKEGLVLSGAYTVKANSRIYLTLTCAEGRVNEVFNGRVNAVSVLWFPP